MLLCEFSRKAALMSEPKTTPASRARDLSGQRFGRLTARERLPQQKAGSYLWRCDCDCGGTVTASASALTRGQLRSCGCLSREARRARARDLSGQRFGCLIAREATDQRGPDGSVLWRCVCDCGGTTLQPSSVLTGGRVTSCGCKSRENDVLRRRLDYIDGTCVQFLQNTGTLRADNTSGTRGVFPHRGKWRARITFKKKTYDLGDYARLEDAVRVRKTAEGQLFGEFLDWYHDSFPRRSGRKEENAST